MTKPRSAREAACAALREWRQEHRFADEILHALLARTGLSAQDRAFATELFYGTLRNLRLLDFWIAQLRSGALDAATRDLLRLGLLQLMILNVPGHAAVFETVELASTRTRSLVNAVLRGAQRQHDALSQAAEALPLAVRTSHPDFLVQRWQERFGEAEAEALCAWNNQPPPIYVRVNRLKISCAEFSSVEPEGEATGHSGFFKFDHLPLDSLARGECYAQDLSTAIACELLDPEPGEHVLDACAAPGGKAAYLAQLMQNRGSLVVTDRREDRVALLRQNFARLGVTIAQSAVVDWTMTTPVATPLSSQPFDRILVDAPCSNTGVMRRRVDARWRLRADDTARMQREQLAIVGAVLKQLRPGGILVYSTCSIDSEENEGVIERLLGILPTLQLERTASTLPFRDRVDGAFTARLRLAS